MNMQCRHGNNAHLYVFCIMCLYLVQGQRVAELHVGDLHVALVSAFGKVLWPSILRWHLVRRPRDVGFRRGGGDGGWYQNRQRRL